MKQHTGLLKQQIKKHLGRRKLPREWRTFLAAIEKTYARFETKERKQERSLVAAQEKLSAAVLQGQACFQAVPGLLLRLDFDGTILDAKSGVQGRLPGLPRKLTGRKVHAVFSSAAEPFQKALSSIRRRKTKTSFEYAAKTKRKTEFFEVHLLPMSGGQIAANIRNITEQKQAKAALSVAENKYRGIFENAVEGIFQTTPEGKFLTVNPGLAHILGFDSPEELMRKRTDIKRQGYVRPERREEFKRLMNERGSVTGFEYQTYRKDGSTAWLSETARAIRDERGKILCYEGFLTDITERKKTEQALRASEERFSKAFHSSPTPMAISRWRDDVIVAANESLLKLLGFTYEELIGRGFVETGLITGEKRKGLREQLRDFRTIQNLEVQLRTKPGEVRDCLVSMELTEMDGEPRVLASLIDITERKTSEELRAGQNQILEMIAGGASLSDILKGLALMVEAQSEGMWCSVLLLDTDGRHLRRGAAPSLPEAYSRALDGEEIGPVNGSCGTAAFQKRTVIVSDILTDPLWENYRHLAAPYGLRACWSTPIFSSEGIVLGTFAMYYREPRSPNPAETRLIDLATQMARIALERKRAEEELFNSRQMLRTVLDTIPQRVFWKDRNSVYVGCNKMLADDCGYADPSELIGKTDFATQSADREIAERYRADDQRVMSTGEPKLNYEEPQIKEDGTIGWLRTSKVPLRNKDGEVIGVLGTYEDITERKRSEVALRTAEQKYRSIFENAVEGIFQSTPEGKFVTVNPSLARILGYNSPDELLNSVQDISQQLYVRPEQRDEYKRILAKEGLVRGFECQLYRKDHSRIWASFYTRVVHGPEGKITYEGTVEDITGRKQLEEQLRQMQKMEAFGQLAAGVAHDFNNILTVIQGNLSLLRAAQLSKADQASVMSQAMAAAERAANLTRQLLLFGRRQLMQPVDLDLNEVVANMTKMLQRLIGEHISLEAHYSPGAAIVHADPGMMEQVLMNLAVNSRDAMPKGGRLILRTSVVSFSEADTLVKPKAQPGEYIELHVSDNGAGIAPEHLSHIFEPFFTTKEIGKGTGLGLATVFGIIEQHRGWIEVESEVGKGTAFRLFLPRHTPAALPAEESLVLPAVRGGSETILLVEDEDAVRQLLLGFLRQHGYKVHEAASGPAALKLWREHRDEIDLLLTDMVMPEGINGRELAEKILCEKPGLKVIYCSGYTDDVLGADSPLRANKNFLEKPFDPHRFLRRVRSCLDGE